MKYKSIFLLLTALIFTITACQKERLTKETQNGAHTFSCKINGKVFTTCPGDLGLFSSGPALWANFSISSNRSILRIGAKCTAEDPYKYIFIDIENFYGVGEYTFADINNSFLYQESYPINKSYISDLAFSGKLVITKDDRVNSIISGTFNLTIANSSNPSDIINISSGRFDIKRK